MKTGLRRNLAKLSLLFGGLLNTPQLLLQLAKIQTFGIGDDLGTGFGEGPFKYYVIKEIGG